MKKIKFSDGYLELEIEKSPEVSLKFFKNSIIKFRVFRMVNDVEYRKIYRINMTNYDKWYKRHKNNEFFDKLEHRAYGFAKALETNRVADFFPDVSWEDLELWYEVMGSDRKFISCLKEKEV